MDLPAIGLLQRVARLNLALRWAVGKLRNRFQYASDLKKKASEVGRVEVGTAECYGGILDAFTSGLDGDKDFAV